MWASFVGSVGLLSEMVEHRLSMLLAEKDNKKSFWFENKPFSASLFKFSYDCGMIQGRFEWTKTSLSDFPSCKIQSVGG